MSFAPRRRKNYIIWKNGRAYYRRVIPAQYREMFGGKTAWVIALKGQGSAALEAEALAYAHKHNQQMSFGEEMPDDAFQPRQGDIMMRVDLRPEDAPPGEPANPLYFMRDGRAHEVYRFAVTNDLGARLQAEAEGFFVMSCQEFPAQMEFTARVREFRDAETPEQREIADLKAERAARDIEDAAKISPETILSILPKWKAFKKQAPMTWQKHEQYITEFSVLHGDLHLSEVTRRHVIEYVEHAMTLTHKGVPLSPTSISKRLDSVRAVLGFAVSRGLLEHNPATGVKPPDDKRPKTSKSWKSFTSGELLKLVEVSTEIWDNRKERTAIGRGADLKVALQCLIWTGARPEEICQLRRADVDIGRRSIRITNDEADDDARAKKTKNEHSVREVPIHPRLMPLLEAHLNSHHHPLLFPTFEPKVRPADLRVAERTGQAVEMRGRYMHPISREWTDNLRAKVVGGDTRKVLYSLRHSWSAESRRAGMPEYVRNALMGHASDNPHAEKYGNDADWLEEKRQYLDLMNCLPA